MKKIFLDDKRSFEIPIQCGYCCVRSYEKCILLISIFKEIDVINLDYDLGEFKTGLDILKYIVNNKIRVKEIYIHSTDSEGVKMMESYIAKHLQHVLYTYSPALDE